LVLSSSILDINGANRGVFILWETIYKGETNMTRTPSPMIDSWYHHSEKAQKFLVTAIDEHSDTVEIQYFDGTLDEIDLVNWYAMDVELVEAPEDWTGPVDIDDLASIDAEMSTEDWDAPYDEEMEKSHAISKKYEVPYEDEA
jgi:hypothetical protein